MKNNHYLPDLMLILVEKKYNVVPVKLDNPDELININTREDLFLANKVKIS